MPKTLKLGKNGRSRRVLCSFVPDHRLWVLQSRSPYNTDGLNCVLNYLISDINIIQCDWRSKSMPKTLKLSKNGRSRLVLCPFAHNHRLWNLQNWSPYITDGLNCVLNYLRSDTNIIQCDWRSISMPKTLKLGKNGRSRLFLCSFVPNHRLWDLKNWSPYITDGLNCVVNYPRSHKNIIQGDWR